MTDTYAIIYLRPDGWWLAGDGFESSTEAVEAGEEHSWGGSRWRVIPSESVESTICEAAKK